MTENFKIKLCLKIFIMFEDIPNSIEETLYLGRDTELPYIPQVYSYILTNLHSNDFGRRRFKVRYVTTPLGYWKNNPTEEKRFESKSLDELKKEVEAYVKKEALFLFSQINKPKGVNLTWHVILFILGFSIAALLLLPLIEF